MGDGWLGYGIGNMMMDVGWGWTVVLLSSSAVPKEDLSTQRAKLMYSTTLKQGSPLWT